MAAYYKDQTSSSPSFGRAFYPGQTQTGLGRRFIFLLPKTAVLPGSDAGSNVKTASNFVIQNRQTCAPCDARYMGHIIRTWSAVFSGTLHSQVGEKARPHLCMDERNRVAPVCRQSSLTQAVSGNFISTGLALVQGIKISILDVFSQYFKFHKIVIRPLSGADAKSDKAV